MVYFDIIRFSFLRFFSYPYEILANVFKRGVELFFLFLLWTLISINLKNAVPVTQIVSYFLISMGISDLVMTKWGEFGSYLGMYIKTGQISNYMIKPVNLIFTIYSISLGRSGMKILLSTILIIAGLIISPPKSAISILIFFMFFVNAWLLGFTFNLFHGVLYLNFTEAMGIKNSIEHIIRILSGSMVPLYFFPDRIRQLVMLTPFPAMIFGPANAFNATGFSPEIIKDILVATFWSASLAILVSYLWRRSIKNYEAIGI